MTQPYLHLVNDVYFINKQIKKINKNYELFYNLNNQKYEIHDISKPKHSLCLSSPVYPSLEMIKKLIKTSTQNMKSLFKEIDAHNKQLDEQKQFQALDTSNQKFKEIMKYAETKPNALSKEEINKIIRN
ncbi:MAG: hypothetical protein IJB98_02560 [Clostridia bacterium]|nr:hypothetical protein [Clostridia bacterium]